MSFLKTLQASFKESYDVYKNYNSLMMKEAESFIKGRIGQRIRSYGENILTLNDDSFILVDFVMTSDAPLEDNRNYAYSASCFEYDDVMVLHQVRENVDKKYTMFRFHQNNFPPQELERMINGLGLEYKLSSKKMDLFKKKGDSKIKIEKIGECVLYTLTIPLKQIMYGDAK